MAKNKKKYPKNKKKNLYQNAPFHKNNRRNKSPLISVCMIVKNEEEFLEQCLNSIKNYVDEIIIVDTGSTDRTIDIAKRFTDKVYFHQWENSFSKARNIALRYATGDWIFQIDADEELMEGSGERLCQVVEDAKDVDVVYVNIFCSYSNGAKKSLHNFERLFRNNGVIHYEGSVHNRVIGGTKAYYSQIELWHYGYDLDEKKSQEKFIRTTGLLKKEIKKDPENPMYHHYLGVSYFSKGMDEDAIEEAEKAIHLCDAIKNNHPLYAWSYFIAAMASYRLGRINRSKKIALKSLEKYPDHMDSFYLLTLISAENGDWDNVYKFGNAFIDILKKYQKDSGHAGLIINNTMNEGAAINLLMGHACHANNLYHEMEIYYNKAYDIADKNWITWWNIGVYHMDKTNDLKLARRFLDLAVKEGPDEHDTWYMLAKLNNKCGLVDDEKLCLDKVIKIGTKETFVYDRLLSLYLKDEQFDRALDLSKTKQIFSSSIYSDLINLGNIFVAKRLLESAVQCYIKAAEAKPDSSEVWNILGEITLSLGRLEESQIFLERAFQINRQDTATILSLCELTLKQGDIESHIKYCDELLKILGLPRDRIIDSFKDLNSIFDEIASVFDSDKKGFERIRNITALLSLDKSDYRSQEIMI